MTNLLLRIDWYSFLAGAQISNAIGTLSSPLYDAIHRHDEGSIHTFTMNGGQTVFLYRYKKPQNAIMLWKTMLHLRAIQKYIIGGFLYLLLEKQMDVENNLVKAFLCGGLLGTYSYFSFTDDQFDFLNEAFMCFLSSAVFATICYEIKNFIIDMDMLSLDHFKIEFPVDLMSFAIGSTTGQLLALVKFSEIVVPVNAPQIQESDTFFSATLKILRFIGDMVFTGIKYGWKIEEKVLVSGVLFCFMKTILKRIIGRDEQIVTIPLCGFTLGVYIGACSGNLKFWHLPKLTCGLACCSGIIWTYLASKNDLMEFTHPLQMLNT